MQLGDSSVLEISSPSKPEMAVMAPQEEAAPSEGVEVIEMEVDANDSNNNNNNSSSGELEEKGREIGEGERVVGGGDEGYDKISSSFGGNRWPRQETLALLKIRSDMDAVFRDSSLKGPLWEEVSRKLAELGYHRSAKKCKEKFENVYKYHKRTKESRSGKSEGKTYKFFDQLQALENHNHHQFTLSSYHPKPQPVLATTKSDGTTIISHATPTFPSTNSIISPSLPPATPAPTNNATTTTTTVTNTTRNQLSSQQPNNISTVVVAPHSLPNNNSNNNMNQIFSSPSPASTSSSTASDEGLEERYRKKRKWKDYFRRLTRKILTKQEEMQKRFLEAIDKRERERVAQEDSWRMQELARINKEHDILVQERSNAAAKDAAVIALLHKLSGQENPPQLAAPPPMPLQPTPPSQASQPQPQSQPPPQPQTQPPPLPKQNHFEIQGMNNGHSVVVTNSTTPTRYSNSSSSRWPKAEIHALIRLRTSLEPKYQENGPKAPLWEDISAGMQRLGYNRSAKRCKEKWENINKYFKKVKESNKQRREDSKTCPYFHELDALYREKSKNNQNNNNNNNPFGSFQNVKSNEMMMEPLMVQPEQQWRPPPQYHDEQQEGVANNKENTTSQHPEKDAAAEEAELEEDEYVDDDIEEDGDSVEDDESASRYEIDKDKLCSVETQLNETR